MKALDFEEAMGRLDDEKILEVVSAVNNEETNNGVDSRRKKRLGRTLLIAAVLAALFSVAAYAVGYSIHQRRQAELREKLNIDASNVQSYVEYESEETQETGVTLLSAIRNGENQLVYVNVAPVEREVAASFPRADSFCFSLDGESWSSVTPALRPGRSVTREEIGAAVLEDAYDEETKTLTLCCIMPNERLGERLDDNGRAELSIIRVGADEELPEHPRLPDWLRDHSCGSVMIAPTELEMRFIRFDGAVFTDPSSGREITVETLELSPTGAIWHLRYDGADELYNTRWNENWTQEEKDAFNAMQGELCGLEDFICQSAALHFTDGTEFRPGGALSSGLENGVALPSCTWVTAIDINAVESVTVGETQLAIH